MVHGMLNNKLSISERKMKGGPNTRMTTQKDMGIQRTRGRSVDHTWHSASPGYHVVDLVPIL